MATLNPAKSNGYYCKYDNSFHAYKNDLYMNDDAIDNAIHYVTRTGKRHDRVDELISYGVAGCCNMLSPDEWITQFNQIPKMVRRKNNVGTRLVHEILTFTKDEEGYLLTNLNSLILIAQYCAKIYFQNGFQCVYGIHYGIHTDEEYNPELTSKRLHIHFMVNAVNYVTGNKFPTKVANKAFTLNGESYFKVPYDTKEREREINQFMYSNILQADNPYQSGQNDYLKNAYTYYPKKCN